MRRLIPLPIYVKALRGKTRQQDYARFYGLYETIMPRRKKRFSFVVRISPKLSNRQVYKKMVEIQNALLNEKIPKHWRGQIFKSFNELLNKTPWKKVRKIHKYQAGVVYER